MCIELGAGHGLSEGWPSRAQVAVDIGKNPVTGP